jgi:hypothetical protein
MKTSYAKAMERTSYAKATEVKTGDIAIVLEEPYDEVYAGRIMAQLKNGYFFRSSEGVASWLTRDLIISTLELRRWTMTLGVMKNSADSSLRQSSYRRRIRWAW